MRHWSSLRTAELVLAYLREHANEDGEVDTSLALVGEGVSIGSITAHRALRRLRDNNAIEVLQRGSGPKHLTRFRLLRDPDLHATRSVPVAGRGAVA